MKIVICCEGQTDIGPITALMKKCLSSHKINIDCKTHAELRKIKLFRSELPKGFKKEGNRINRVAYIRRLWHIANISESHHIALHQDCDHQDFDKVYRDIHNEFDNVLKHNVKRLIIIPKETIESWLLADGKAYPSIPNNPRVPSKPEEIWGQRSDPKSYHPYNFFVRVLAQFYLPDNRETYAQIAEKADIEVLKRRCPKSFGQFFKDLEKFIKDSP